MTANMKKLVLAAAAAAVIGLGSLALPAPVKADPFVGLDTAQAAALSLSNAYYTNFLYSDCDFTACAAR